MVNWKMWLSLETIDAVVNCSAWFLVDELSKGCQTSYEHVGRISEEIFKCST